MKITHLFLFCLFSLLNVSSLYAQGDQGLPEVEGDRWEVGMDLLWLRRTGISPTVFLRKNIIRQKKKEFGFRRNAYRMTLNFRTYNEISYSIDTANLTKQTYTRDIIDNSFSLQVGYEWQENHKSGIMVYYGGDVYTSFGLTKNQHLLGRNFNADDGVFLFKNYDVGIIPFIGLKYPITKNFSASIEANLDLSYQMSFMSRIEEDFQINRRAGSFHTYFHPVRIIAISYLF